MLVNLKSIQYNLNDNGETQSIAATFESYANNENVNAKIALTADDITDLDNTGRKDIETAARKKLVSYIQTTGTTEATDTK